MKKTNFFWMIMTFMFMISCTSDHPGQVDEEYGSEKDGVYFSVLLNPSNGTRSTTSGPNSSTGGEEVGTDAENKVNEVLVVLADKYYKLIACTTTKDFSQAFASGQTEYKATAELNKTTLASYYSSTSFDREVYVFVFCNPTDDFIHKMNNVKQGNTDWTDFEWTYTGETDVIWSSTKGFMMSNQSLALRQLPATMADWKNYSKKESPFDLSGKNFPGAANEVDNLTNKGAINVHRMAARFDFRDGSQMKDDDDNIIGNGVAGSPFTYAVVKNDENETIVNCKIYAMALSNMSKTQYYLHRVSTDGLPKSTDNDFILCGAEQPWINNSGNYVVSTNSNAKLNGITTNFDSYFLYPFFKPEGKVQDRGEGWYWIQCEKLFEKTGDKDNFPSDNYEGKNYKVWRYVTENTIPAVEDNQKNAQSTGIIFKTRMLATDVLKNSSDPWEQELYKALEYNADNIGEGKLLNKNTDTDPILYSLSGNMGSSLYVTWKNVQAVALEEAGFDATKGQNQNLNRNAPLYKLVYGNSGVGTVKDASGNTIYSEEDLDADENSANELWVAWDNARQNDKASANEATTKAKMAFKEKATHPKSS